MPQKIKNADGEEIEVYTAAELEEQAKARAREIADTEIARTRDEAETQLLAERERLEAEKEAALAEKDAEFATKEEELNKLKQKDMNFENLRKSKTLTPEQEAERKLNAEKLARLESVVESIAKQPLEAAKEQFMSSNFTEDEKNEREVFEKFYQKLSIGAKDLKGVNDALVAAFNATMGGVRAPSRAGQMVRTGVSDNYNSDPSGRESDASREFGVMFGVSAADKARFGDTIKTGKVSLFSQNAPKAQE